MLPVEFMLYSDISENISVNVVFCSPQNIFIGNKNRKCDFYFYWFILMNGKNN